MSTRKQFVPDAGTDMILAGMKGVIKSKDCPSRSARFRGRADPRRRCATYFA